MKDSPLLSVCQVFLPVSSAPTSEQSLIQALFHSLSKAYCFNIINYSCYWKYDSNITESKDIDWNITESD